MRDELIRKDQEIAELEEELDRKQKSIDKLKGIEAERDRSELELYRSENRVKALIDSNHDLSNQVENLNSSYENLLCKNEELKSKILRLRNELELLNIPYKKQIKADNRRMSDPDLIRLMAHERHFDGNQVRNLKNSDETQADGEKIPFFNEPELNTWKNIESMKTSIKKLQHELQSSNERYEKIRKEQADAEEKCDLLETHLTSAAKVRIIH